MVRARRADRPVPVMAAARMKAPRMKKTASLPNWAKTCFSFMMPARGSSAMERSAVTAIGRIPETQRKMVPAKRTSER